MALASTTISDAAQVPAGAGRLGQAPAAAVTLTALAAPDAAARPARNAPELPRTPRQIAKAMLVHRFGWKSWQFKYLNRLWATESGWNRYASNPYSGV